MSKPKHITEKQTQNFYTRATVDNNSVVDTETERSFEVVFATQNPVLRYSYFNDERFNEILVCDPANIRAGRLEALAVPLLDNHDRYSGVEGQLGRADSFSIQNGECRAKILFSLDEKHTGIWKNIKAGIVRSISCGYAVYKYIREEVINSEVPNYRAVDWEPMEISLAPVPADFSSKIERKEGGPSHDVVIEHNSPAQNNRSNMEVEKKEGEVTPTNQPTQERSAAPPIATPVVDENKVRSEGAAAERARVTEINNMVRSAKLKNEFAEKLINDGTTVEQSRKLVIDELAKQDTTPNGGPSASARGDEKEGQRNAAIDGLMHRAKPGVVELKDQAHDFKHMKLVRLAEERLRAFGERTLGLSQGEIIGRAIATTDYPQILGTTVQRFLRKFYEAQSFAWKNIASPVSAPDFRQKNGLGVSGKITFEEVSQNGEYKQSQIITEENASVKLKTYGRKISIGRQSIINDDLGVFNHLPNLIAQGANLFQADKVWALLTNNVNAPDGKAIFHTDHGNLAAGAVKTPPAIASLSAARTAFRKIKTPAGDFMPLVPKILVVPAELETAAEQLMTSLLANQVGNINPFSGKFTILTDPHLTDANAWYVAADPSTFQSLVYAYLEGEEGIYTESKVDFDNDAVVTKARLDFDCAAWDYRGWYKNPGA